ncbi:hypothetical protein GGH94_002908 [Coemansia aciculifera]|uniref:Uncharacterized protein n=1 Tax=Coemansia aciculifera TaxID=417176 RepID=A0A9W8M6A0_9FUNG|nr:hypothetical protein GGH94_002908 [Coemansia aciculifera]
MSNSRAGWQQQKQQASGSANPTFNTPPARVSDSRQQFGSERHLTPRSATAMGRNLSNGLAVNTNRLSHPASPWSARTHSPAVPVRGRPAAPHSIGRRLSEASSTAIPNYSPTTYGRGNTRPQVYSDSLFPLASAHVSGTTRDGSSEWSEPFPGMHYSSYDSTISDMHTPHAEQRPSSRGSMHSTTSASAFQLQPQPPPTSGKAPYFVNSIKIDAKVVPPQLDAIKSRRRSSKAPHSSKLPQGPLHARQQARVRVRMDVDVKILHPGEQCLDLLSIGQTQQWSQQPRRGLDETPRSSRYYHPFTSASASAAGSQVHVEHAVCSVVSAPEHHIGPAISPLSSPRMASQSQHLAPTEHGEPDGQRPSSLESTSAAAVSSQEPATHGTLTRKPNFRARQAPVFHANAVSPYPPPPPTLTTEQRPGLGSQVAVSALPGGSDLQQSSRYESHTMASYLRAQARVSDRAAIYSDFGESPLRQSALVRRTLSFNTESGLDGLTNAMAQRPTSALGDLREIPGLHFDNQLHAERPRSSMGFVRHRLRANSEVIPTTAGHSALPDRSDLRADLPAVMDKQAHVSSARSLSEYSSEFDAANRAPLCEFGPDLARGVFVARFYEPHHYRLTVWFFVPAEAMPIPGDQMLPAGGLTPDSANHSAGVCPDTPPSMPTLYSWETGNMHLKGLPRSVRTTVRVRLPHRQMVVHESATEANGNILLGFADNQPCLESLTALDGSSVPPATPKRQIMQVNIADVPSSIYTSRPKGSSLMASNLSSVSDITGGGGGGRGQGCFYRVKMQQPGHVEPSLVRTESARTASTRAPARAPGLLLYPDSPSTAPLGRSASTEGDLAGWLNTDDSDAAENEFDHFSPVPPPTTAYESPCGDIETLLDNRLQRFIDEYGHRDLASDEQPHLVDSDGKLDTGDASLGPSRPRSRSELQQARMDSGHAIRPSWTDFAQRQTQVDGIDYQRTELTVFKLSLADSISFSWAPRLSEYCHPVVLLDKTLEAEAVPTMPPSGDDAVAPGLGRLLLPPPLTSMSASRHVLETIFSAESTPVGSGRLDSASALTFSEPPTIESPALPVSTKSSKVSAPAVHVSIERTELGVTLQSGGLRVQSTISLRLHSPTWGAEDEAIAHSDQLYDWPEYLDLEFAPMRYSVGSLEIGQCASANVSLVHRSVTICCAKQPEHTAEWLSGAVSALGCGTSSNRTSQGTLRPSCLRVWIPGTTSQLSPILVLSVESEPATHVQLSSMLLTERLLVALPRHLVSLILLSTPALPSTDTTGSESKLTKLTNRAGLWVTAAIVNSEDGNQAPTDCHIVAIEKRSANSMPGLALAYDRQQQLATAYAELSNDGAVLTPLTSPTASSVSVVVGGGKQGEVGLSVQVTLKCSLATFVPWRIQLGSSASSMAASCLALRLPAAVAGCSPWVISGLEQTSAAGDSGRMASTQLICLDSTLVGIPLANRRQPDNTLSDEVVIDTVECVLTASIDREQFLAAKSLPDGQAEHAVDLGTVLSLPTLLFSASDVASVCKALDIDDLCFEYSSIARLSGSLLSAVLVSVTTPCLQVSGTILPIPRLVHKDTIACPIGACQDTSSGDSEWQDSLLGVPLVEHRFQLSDSSPLKLQLVPTLPEVQPELVARYVDTSDLALPPTLEVSSACPEAETEAEDEAGDVLPIPYTPLGEELVSDDGASAQGTDVSSIESNSGGSLRNRHARARVDQPTDLGGLFQPPPATETDPLLARCGPSETASAISLSDGATGTTRSWRAALMAFRTVVCMVVIGALVLLAKDRLFNMPIHPGWPMRGNALTGPVATQLPLAMAAPEAAVAIDLSTHPIYISIITPAPQETGTGPIRFRARAKHNDESEQQKSASVTVTTAAPEAAVAAATTLVVMSNDGAHTFAAPTDATPLLGWLYKSVIGSVLELFGL